MPDISFTDNLGTPLEAVKIDLSQPSSLLNYARAQLLHLIVAPDFLALQDRPLAQAAPQQAQFQATLGNDFPLGTVKPAIILSPKGQSLLTADASHAGLSVTGSFAVGLSSSDGDLTFGLDAKSSLTLGFVKAFTSTPAAPSLGGAVGQMISAFVIPASVADLALLHPGDVASVSGQGSLKLKGSFTVSALVNPLASVNLPLNAGTLDVKDGVMAGVSASVTLSGAYNIRASGLDGGAVTLRFEKQKGVALRGDITVSASASVKVGSTDLVSGLLGAISKSDVDPKLLQGLTSAEGDTFHDALKECLDHTLQASLDLALSTSAENDCVFEYEIQPSALNAVSTAAINAALHGDLTALTELAPSPGVTLRDNLFTRMHKAGISLKVNLLGIVNLISIARLISKCEILSDAASGAVTIKETASSERIGAITEPLNRQEALRKAIFESVLVTTTYRASGIVAMPELHCANLHFVENSDTTAATVRGYLNWFAALNLMAKGDMAAALADYPGDTSSTCLLRTELDDKACENLFFDAGKPREESYYREFARYALRAMLHPDGDEIEQARYAFLNDPATWAQAVKMGPSAELRHLVPLAPDNPRFDQVQRDVTGDLYDIVWWAQSMTNAGAALLKMRQFLKGRDPVGLKDDPEFQHNCQALQKLMLGVVANCKARFGEPWGMVSLFWSAGSPAGATGLVRAGAWSVSRP